MGKHMKKNSSTRGTRQGCPLSPYLFVLAVNELSLLLQQELTEVDLAGIRLGSNCTLINSLLFADDLLIYGEANPEEAHIIQQTLQSYQHSGQLPNWSKSGIVFSKAFDIKFRIKSDTFFMSLSLMKLLFILDTLSFFQPKT
jgi:hypothetical protein